MVETSIGNTFIARVEGAPAGILGTVQVGILDNVGGVVMPLTTTGIIEDPPLSGSYVVTLDSPDTRGVFSIYWSWGSEPSKKAFEELVVGIYYPSPTPPTPFSEYYRNWTPLDSIQISPSTVTKIPHFSIPFSLDLQGHPKVNAQGSKEEVDDCVEAILRTEVGTRLYVPAFGIDDPTFQSPVDTGSIQSQIAVNEPRAIATITSAIDVDNLITKVRVVLG